MIDFGDTWLRYFIWQLPLLGFCLAASAAELLFCVGGNHLRSKVPWREEPRGLAAGLI